MRDSRFEPTYRKVIKDNALLDQGERLGVKELKKIIEAKLADMPTELLFSYPEGSMCKDKIIDVEVRLTALGFYVVSQERESSGDPMLLHYDQVFASGAHEFPTHEDATPSIWEFLKAQEECPFQHSLQLKHMTM